MEPIRKFKTVKRFHEPGDFHELTFSCYRRMPLLTNDRWCEMLARAVDRALDRWNFRLHAFVFMPEHVHLLVFPNEPKPAIDNLLKAIKRPYSFRIKLMLEQANSPLRERLTVQERPGVTCFRYWQEGPGYDRNLQTPQAVLASLEYIHNNPVKRGLCRSPAEWKWSSARFYQSDGVTFDADLPRIDPIPAEFFDGYRC